MVGGKYLPVSVTRTPLPQTAAACKTLRLETSTRKATAASAFRGAEKRHLSRHALAARRSLFQESRSNSLAWQARAVP